MLNLKKTLEWETKFNSKFWDKNRKEGQDTYFEFRYLKHAILKTV